MTYQFVFPTCRSLKSVLKIKTTVEQFNGREGAHCNSLVISKTLVYETFKINKKHVKSHTFMTRSNETINRDLRVVRAVAVLDQFAESTTDSPGLDKKKKRKPLKSTLLAKQKKD